MTKTLVEKFVQDPIQMRLFQQEQAIIQVTELIEQVMDEQGVSRAQLAELLGKSKGWVTQLLDGESNKTIRTIADVLAVLGREHISSAPSIMVSNENTYRIVLDDYMPWGGQDQYVVRNVSDPQTNLAS